MSNRKLGLFVELHDRRGLKTIARALRKGHGAKAAAAELGVSRTTLTRWGDTWEAVGKLLRKYTLEPAQVASLGGSTTAANRKAAR